MKDEKQVIDQGFQKHRNQLPTFHLYAGRYAVSYLDQKVSESKKRLNALRGTSSGYRRQIRDFETEYATIVQEANGIAKDRKQNGRIFRQLENSFDKARLKVTQAIHIHKLYDSLHSALKKESLYFGEHLLQQQKVVDAARKELDEFQAVYGDAQVIRDWMKKEMNQRESKLCRQRHEQDAKFNDLQSKCAYMKAEDEAKEKQLQALRDNEMRLFDEIRKPNMNDALRAIKLDEFDLLFDALYKAVGNCEAKLVPSRLQAQVDAKTSLIEMKAANVQNIMELQLQLDHAVGEYDHLVFRENKDKLRWHDDLKKREETLKNVEETISTVTKDYAKKNDFLAKIKLAIEHLEDLVKYQETDEDAFYLNPSFDDFLQPFFVFESKITRLYDQFKKPLTELGKTEDMKEDGYHGNLESLFPSGNVRISPNTSRRSVVASSYDGEEDVKEDNIVDPARALMKMKSLKLIEIKSKRRFRRRSRM